MEVFGSSGKRGVANEELTPAFVLRVAKAAGTAWQVDRVAIARDTRYTGRMLADAAASGLASTGTNVDRLGIVPTPGAQGYAERMDVPVIVITASHNPPQYNGIKLVGRDGVELAVSDLETIEDTLLAGEFAVAPWDETGRVREIDTARRDYVADLLAAADRETIAEADLTVALDPGHGAGALTSPEFFRELGCRVVTVNSQPDGHFPGRDPEPVPDNLGDLGRLVRTSDADVGIAHDGDADRAIFFDESGAFVSGDAALAALAAAELEPGETTVSAVNVSQRLVDVITEIGADLELTPIGSTNIITRIEELEANGEHVPIAGEGNGGIFFPDYRLSRDGAYTAARFLELVAQRPVSDLVGPYDGYANVRRNIEYESTAERDAMLDAAANHAQSADAELNTRDGYRLDHGDAWVLARPSGTEPLVRIYAEARDGERATELANGMYETLSTAKTTI
ncbi:phosphoglucosamine mutase [Natrialba asiatica]|uniref:Phosphoglucosamine mutase n=1 Tax=Natrialba asiatica (strain ATCC 700177 / DSM 12278 / JCM 9576 / FERM P-10747 / NBRC 102637 / 172P1) TaxID=29540 RepID=M0AHG8_NATA1|nr:phosphoglucosamine mutase [Natrialba asiatica]ELY98130.1 phosphoglucosamine mutase [Natrialba asiatica DSM 12278]